MIFPRPHCAAKYARTRCASSTSRCSVSCAMLSRNAGHPAGCPHGRPRLWYCACGYGAHARTKASITVKHRRGRAPQKRGKFLGGHPGGPSPALSRRRWPSAAAIRAPPFSPRNSPARARPARRSAPLASRVRTRTRPDFDPETPSLVAPSSNRVDPDFELAAREPGTNDCGAQCALPRQTFQERTQGLDYALGRRCPLVRRRGPAQELDLRARAKAQAVEHLRGQTRVAQTSSRNSLRR